MKWIVYGTDRRDGYDVVAVTAPTAAAALDWALRRFLGTRFRVEGVRPAHQS